MTTAASIWLVAAIGMAVGTGTYFLAVFATILSMISLILLAPVSHRLEHRAEVRRMMDQGSQKGAAEEDDREDAEAKFLD